MSKESPLRTAPLILLPVLARTLGVHVLVLEKAMTIMGIEGFQSTPTARKLISLDQAERIAGRVRPQRNSAP